VSLQLQLLLNRRRSLRDGRELDIAVAGHHVGQDEQQQQQQQMETIDEALFRKIEFGLL
jgi:hypothetical protein